MALPEIAAVLDEQPVTITPGVKPPVLVSAADKLTKAPDTTDEENLHSKSQRKVNLIWEVTQAGIAVMVTAATIATSMMLAFRNQSESSLQLLSNAFFLIVGFYFQRLNHTNVGGVQLPTQGRK